MARDLHRVQVSHDYEVFGPFPTADAVAAVGHDMVHRLVKTGGIFWADHSKRAYFAFQEVRECHAKNVSWQYSIPLPTDKASVHYGRVKIMHYEQCCLVLDTFSREVYYAPTLVDAFEIAVSIAHFFPNSRSMPELEPGMTMDITPAEPQRADFQALTSHEQNYVWVESDKVPVSLDRTVSLSLADAISILYGERPSQKFLADVAMTYPQALVATYGAALVCFDPKSTQLAVAQSITSLSQAVGIPASEAFASFADKRMVGRYKIVAGWGYRMMEEAMPDINMVAAIDLALAQSSSPEITRATLRGLIASAAAPCDE